MCSESIIAQSFLVLTISIFVLTESFTTSWIQPFSIDGILRVALIGRLTGELFVCAFAAAERLDDVVETQLFTRIVTLLT